MRWRLGSWEGNHNAWHGGAGAGAGSGGISLVISMIERLQGLGWRLSYASGARGRRPVDSTKRGRERAN